MLPLYYPNPSLSLKLSSSTTGVSFLYIISLQEINFIISSGVVKDSGDLGQASWLLNQLKFEGLLQLGTPISVLQKSVS